MKSGQAPEREPTPISATRTPRLPSKAAYFALLHEIAAHHSRSPRLGDKRSRFVAARRRSPALQIGAPGRRSARHMMTASINIRDLIN
jgi:hypothetical protein